MNPISPLSNNHEYTLWIKDIGGFVDVYASNPLPYFNQNFRSLCKSDPKLVKQFLYDMENLKIARVIANRSHCERSKVGALIVNTYTKSIVSEGYNGTPTGFPNRCECEGDASKTDPIVLHAESNAIAKMARSTHSSQGCTMYVTLSPCLECAKLIIQAGIERLVFEEQYRKSDGLELLIKADVEIVRVDPSGYEKMKEIIKAEF